MINKILELIKGEFIINGEINKRYYHTTGVIYMALELNRIHQLGIPEEKIIYASAFHDVAKYMNKEEMIDIISKHFPMEKEELLEYPSIWHSFVGSIYVKEKYNITDQEILDAIKYHTTGRPNMTNLEKLIFVSDYVEEVTRKEDEMIKARQIARESLDKGVMQTLIDTKNYLQSTNRPIYKLTEETYQFYLKNVRNNV